MKKYKTALVWFRNDLRTRDHEPLHQACQEAQEVVLAYCLHPDWKSWQTAHGFAKIGPHRGYRLSRAINDLAARVSELGGTLNIMYQAPEQAIPDLVARSGAAALYYYREPAQEERDEEEAVCEALCDQAILIKPCWGRTLYHPDDVPFADEAVPDVYTQFRKKVEKYASVRSTFPVPAAIPSPTLNPPHALDEALPEHFTDEEIPSADDRTAVPFDAGESAALAHLQTYIWRDQYVKTYKETRNGLIGAAYSTKFSSWLAIGALSPRVIYEEIRRFEERVTANKSTYWVIFELIWRDYFTYVYRKYGNALFRASGIKGEPIRWSYDEEAFEAWRRGETGIPFVDANMRELLLTGFMSNRGRQNVASFLTKDLKIDWRWGAEWFEHCLIDHDVFSNYGNWNYVAGVGNDPRENRYFNILSQATRYDEHGEYVRLWVPELQDLPGKQVHYFPVNHPRGAKEYPKALVDARKWVKGR